MEKEIWKDIKGFEGLYKISNYGNVQSLERRNFGGRNLVTSRILKANRTHPYAVVVLCKNNKHYNKLTHRLIAIAFLKNSLNKPEVNHKDGNKRNNYVKNLEWVTREENYQHASRNKLLIWGENHYLAKLNINQVKEIRNNKILTQRQLAKKHGVCQRTIAMVIHEISWKHVV